MGWTVEGIQKQVKRLKAMPRQQDEDRPWDVCKYEFERALQNVAVDDNHAKEIVDQIIDTARFMPSVVEVRAAAGSLAKSLEEIRPDPDCTKCGGSGSIVVERGGLSGALHCACWARRALPTWATPEVREKGVGGKGLVSVAEIGSNK